MSAHAVKEKISPLLSAKEAQEKLAMAVAEEAADFVRARAAEQAEKQRLIEKLSEPSDVPDEEAMQRVAAIVARANPIRQALGNHRIVACNLRPDHPALPRTPLATTWVAFGGVGGEPANDHLEAPSRRYRRTVVP